jgi:hypothetical protein
MSDFEVRVEGADIWIARFRKAPEIVKTEMVKGIDRLTFAGQAVSQKEAPVDTGTYRRSITQHKATFAGGTATGSWGTNLPYARPIEDGRSAGSAMPPSGVLLGWMRRHGADAKAEFVIRRAIGRKGIKAKHPMQKGRLAIQPKVKPEFIAVRDRIVAQVGGG